MLSMLPIVPRYKLLMCYDIRRNMNDRYYHYVMREFVPALQEMGIYVTQAWYTAYGEYPIRQVEYVVDNLDILHSAFASQEWQELEDRLQSYTTRYSRKIVPYRRGFQF